MTVPPPLSFDDLLREASSLSPLPSPLLEEFAQKREPLVASLNKTMLQHPDLLRLIGPHNQELMQNNHTNHALFVESILTHFNAKVLVETVLWVFRTYRVRGFHPDYWTVQLHAWLDLLHDTLSRECFDAVSPLYRWLIQYTPSFVRLSNEPLSPASSL